MYDKKYIGHLNDKPLQDKFTWQIFMFYVTQTYEEPVMWDIYEVYYVSKLICIIVVTKFDRWLFLNLSISIFDFSSKTPQLLHFPISNTWATKNREKLHTTNYFHVQTPNKKE